VALTTVHTDAHSTKQWGTINRITSRIFCIIRYNPTRHSAYIQGISSVRINL